MRLELIFLNVEICGIYTGLDEIEEVLNQILNENELGEVTGSGTGDELSNVDIEIYEENLPEVIRTLRENVHILKIPSNTKLRYTQDGKEAILLLSTPLN